MELDLATIGLLALTATVAGFVDAIAGGGGLITLPALLLAGLSPVEAVATNKLQGTAGVTASTWTFWRHGSLDAGSLRLVIAATAVGALAGSLLVSALDAAWLARVAPFALIVVALYFAAAPWLQPRRPDSAVSLATFSLGAAMPIGFYDGLFGPGAGSFYMLALVALLNLDLVRATASTKALNLTSNLVSLMVFSFSGHLVLAAGLPMAAGQALGGVLGARAALVKGATVIRPLVILMACALALRLLTR